MKKRVFVPLLLLVLLLGVVPAAWAAPSERAGSADTVIESGEVVNNDVVLVQGDLEIREGAIVNGDVTLADGDAVIDGQVNGSVAIFRGDAEVNGWISGNLTLFDGDLDAGPAAEVSGPCVLLNGDFDGAEGADVSCTNVVDMAQFNDVASLFSGVLPAIPALPVMPDVPAMPTMPAMPAMPDMDDLGSNNIAGAVGARESRPSAAERIFGGLAMAAGSAFLGGLLGLFIGAVAPESLRRMTTTAERKPVAGGVIGGLTAVAVPSLIVLLIPLSIILTLVCIGLLGFPIMLLLGLGLLVGLVVGWVVVGNALGRKVLRRNKDYRVATTAALGTALLGVLQSLTNTLSPFLAGLLTVVFVLIGLGAVVLTQFGRKSYPRPPATAGADRAVPAAGEDPNKIQVVLETLPPDEKMMP